ncbi:hypothetical protein ES703_01591 [subsurface metagenome]
MRGIFFLCKILVLPTLFMDDFIGQQEKTLPSFANRGILRGFSIFYVKNPKSTQIDRWYIYPFQDGETKYSPSFL